MQRVFWSGFPGPCGGANTECYHTARLLREAGVPLTFVPTVGAGHEYKSDLLALGCDVVECAFDKLGTVDGLSGSTVISMCNSFFATNAHFYKQIGCKVVWVNCMTFCLPEELAQYRRHGMFDKFVFQSEWQREQISPSLRKFGYMEHQGHLIRGAFFPDMFPFNPRSHLPGTEFVFGKLSRMKLDKYSSNLWPVFRSVAYKPRKVRVMAWNDEVQQKCGTPPDFAECLDPCAETSQDFLSSLHCLIHINGGAGENWPRVGLEAMASGVPVIAQNQWGWKEMVKHGETGFLTSDNVSEISYYATLLAYDEKLRLDIAEAAYERVKVLSDPETIWPKWQEMLEELQ